MFAKANKEPGSPKSSVPFDMVIIRRQVNPSLDAWQIRSSQRMGRPFICLINSEPLSIFNHQKGNEINNLMMPAPPYTRCTHTHTQNNTHEQMSIYRSFDYERRKRHLQWYMIKLLFMIYQKTGSFFYLWESHSLSFNPACSAVSLLNHTVRRWVHTVPQRSWACHFTAPIPQT